MARASVDTDLLRACLAGEAEYEVIGLTDLPTMWDRAPDEGIDRIQLLLVYWNLALSKPWAWRGLERLLLVLRERGEPIPDMLQEWALCVACKQLTEPAQKRGRKRKDERNARIVHAFLVLRGAHGLTREEAIERIAEATGGGDTEHIGCEAVRSIIKALPALRTAARGAEGA